MVMTLEGTAYYLDYAYSYWGDTYTEGGDYCGYTYPPDDRVAGARDGTNGTRTAVKDRASRKAARAPGASQPRSATNKHAARRHPNRAAQPVANNMAGSQNYRHGNDVHATMEKVVFYGDAVVFSGAVTTLAGPAKEKWDWGKFEFVPYFGDYGDWGIDDGLDATYP